MYNPVATYRIQFHKGFTLADFDAQISYFKQLGIRTIYASPIFKAVPGSMHGYDVVNPYVINPEIGTEEMLIKIILSLKAAGIGWIQDIVPNHMAFHHSNPWLMDVLEKGMMSVYASFFDVTWSGDFYASRLMVPFLAGPLEEVIAKKELALVYEPHALFLKNNDAVYPINTRSFKSILTTLRIQAPQSVAQFIDQLEELHQVSDPVMYALRSREVMMQFAALMLDAESQGYVEDCVTTINNDPAKLQALADGQFYRLCSWRETTDRINYRRFFTVNGLICLNMDDKQVFDQYHQRIKWFVDEGLFQGLRVDHVDGLYDPQTYLTRLRHLCGPDTYIIVEKILEPSENLSATWPVQGTTGYEFLAFTNNLFTQQDAEKKFSAFYNSLVGDRDSVSKKIREKKSAILFGHMAGELANLTRFFIEKNLMDEASLATVHEDDIKSAIASFLIHCPVYRFYGNRFPLAKQERKDVELIFKACQNDQPQHARVLALVHDALFKKNLLENETYNHNAIRFYQRCMQFSGPLMAKGVEDTLMYTFNRFVGHNEVGDSPGFFGLTVDDFHTHMIDRQLHWPLALNGTSTHDTKRGEDARMRLNVLPDLAAAWIALVKMWMSENAVYKTDQFPDQNDEYFVYQTLVGAWPIMLDKDNFISRLEEYFTKAMREAKRYSDWAEPDSQYEQALLRFLRKILEQPGKFLESFLPFEKKVSDYGFINSLGQLLLKFTCPGVPDIYQGTTDWDFSLVDPDNRRPVNFTQHQETLTALTEAGKDVDIRKLWHAKENGQIKLWLTHALLKLRNEFQEIFTSGAYTPLKVKGKYRENCIAFARHNQRTWIVSIVPLNFAKLSEGVGNDILAVDWLDTHVIVPPEAPGKWRHRFIQKNGSQQGALYLNDVLIDIPVAVLELSEPERTRKAGILMSISSLPSEFGIGDFGPTAKRFADFLLRSRQRLWQLLPLNATSEGAHYSPYSAYSSMAGNSLFISAELLLADRLLSEDDLNKAKIKSGKQVDYSSSERIKNHLLDIAWSNYRKTDEALKVEFEKFAAEEKYWLDDFALFEFIQARQNGKLWYEWPEDLKTRDAETLERIKQDSLPDLEKIKWIQFIFSRQWHQLRVYCNDRGIELIGDLPFYISYHSADVWTHPEYFKLDEHYTMTGMAGVPPDYFNASGQSWGMPVFNWEMLKAHHYDWWIKRIQKNLEWYDLLRLDHFRAFVDFWEIPAGSANAVTGAWNEGPGIDFFRKVNMTLGTLPFIAEDLGKINHEVFALRDELKLPGMKILQFAFDENMPQSQDIPHNYTTNFVVYTGTHDNNTTRGWYRQDISDKDRQRIDEYFNIKLREKTITKSLTRLAYSSVANMAIIPMQDILNLDEASRMNMPSTTEHNWTWKMDGRLTASLERELRMLTFIYNR